MSLLFPILLLSVVALLIAFLVREGRRERVEFERQVDRLTEASFARLEMADALHSRALTLLDRSTARMSKPLGGDETR